MMFYIKLIAHLVTLFFFFAKIGMNLKCAGLVGSKRESEGGVSLMPGVELILVLPIVLSNPFFDSQAYNYKTLGLGLFVISVLSYLPLYLKLRK